MLFFSFEYEREGLEPEKARAGVQSAGGTLGSERAEPAEGLTKAERAAEETACERSEAGGQVLSPEATAIRRRLQSAVFLLRKILTVLGKKTIM